MQRNTLIALFTATTLLAGGVSLAVASTAAPANDALAAAQAKVGLTQAIAAAEQHVGGKATKAEFDDELGQTRYEIEVVKGQQVMDVKIDATSGAVLSAKADSVDHNGEHEGEMND